MSEKAFMQGNKGFAESAIRAGCRYFFGYPITPSSEVPEYYALRAPEEDLVFIQAETEVAAFNMVAGVAATGQRGMTATSGPGFSLGAEAMSYMAAARLPSVILNVMRPGPADGDILAAQGDYFQVVKGGGHGDYNTIVLAPFSVQEMVDFAPLAFTLAEKYLNPVVVLSDGMLSKMMENVTLPERTSPSYDSSSWAVNGAVGRKHNVITTCALGPEHWEQFNLDLQANYAVIKANEQRWEEYQTDDADIIIVAYGTVARIALATMKLARAEGIKVGLIRPISLWPFPEKAFTAHSGKQFLVVELSAGQMVEDVKLSVDDKHKVAFYGRLGGITPTPVELLNTLRETYVSKVKVTA